jgi:hypothetical protein
MDQEDANTARRVQAIWLANTETGVDRWKDSTGRDLVLFLVCILAMHTSLLADLVIYVRFAAVFTGLSLAGSAGMWWFYDRRLAALRSSQRAP